ncbi:DNA-binding transcription factor, MADS-box Pvg4 [Schizosaccharomyces pombe]|uniref:MADS-box transcription factor pvg4 n=1 Tax=Schizosaccharomyces pombe (strain 972 / ATCC 24843) TaxID=284812 RepID=PVG4_SCHPO|nr:putative MADS-box transcription factor Pvg4 [Schizosaccharomyces pombe]Q9HGP0.1 RecName: Full=MADS-box transcription factor pvg4; AltName: Full=MADS-box transcription factor 2; AltName: Full=Pyruvylated Gal-beta-1,3-epitope synthesis protein 4; Short=PvGal synthesis protein 4 [Schizosaccharomyces pombe 972h-]CAC01946.1 MADS-box transcription factor Pvg4 (predicted) [Schizosaccharomyces pombe]|eukprot:NP_596507.1 putative MADS-box transcription factor Pvg4 [Schizosaccharomyces pombe]
MGRKKISIAPITDDRSRSVTFVKRKQGLYKKAYELAVLADCEVAVTVIDRKGRLHVFCSSDYQRTLQQLNTLSIYELKNRSHFSSSPVEESSTVSPETTTGSFTPLNNKHLKSQDQPLSDSQLDTGDSPATSETTVQDYNPQVQSYCRPEPLSSNHVRSCPPFPPTQHHHPHTRPPHHPPHPHFHNNNYPPPYCFQSPVSPGATVPLQHHSPYPSDNGFPGHRRQTHFAPYYYPQRATSPSLKQVPTYLGTHVLQQDQSTYDQKVLMPPASYLSSPNQYTLKNVSPGNPACPPFLYEHPNPQLTPEMFDVKQGSPIPPTAYSGSSCETSQHTIANTPFLAYDRSPSLTNQEAESSFQDVASISPHSLSDVKY